MIIDKCGYICTCESASDLESNKHEVHTSTITGILLGTTVKQFSLLVEKQSLARWIGQHRWMHSIEISQSS